MHPPLSLSPHFLYQRHLPGDSPAQRHYLFTLSVCPPATNFFFTNLVPTFTFIYERIDLIFPVKGQRWSGSKISRQRLIIKKHPEGDQRVAEMFTPTQDRSAKIPVTLPVKGPVKVVLIILMH